MKHMSTSTPASMNGLSKITTYQAGILQSSANRLLQKYCDEVLQPYGITKMQWLITGAVLDAGAGGIRITELADTLSTTLPYLTNTVNLLESKKILKRISNSKDERSKLVTVDPAYVRKCKIIEQDLRAHLRDSIYSNISPQEFRTYMRVLHKLSQIE